MDFKQVLKVVTDPYWTPQPLTWHKLSHFAKEGSAGKFNLAWWAMGFQEPPVSETAHITPSIWATMAGPSVMLERRSLEHHAAMISAAEFEALLRRNQALLREHQGFNPLHRLLGLRRLA